MSRISASFKQRSPSRSFCLNRGVPHTFCTSSFKRLSLSGGLLSTPVPPNSDLHSDGYKLCSQTAFRHCILNRTHNMYSIVRVSTYSNAKTRNKYLPGFCLTGPWRSHFAPSLHKVSTIYTDRLGPLVNQNLCLGQASSRCSHRPAQRFCFDLYMPEPETCSHYCG